MLSNGSFAPTLASLVHQNPPNETKRKKTPASENIPGSWGSVSEKPPEGKLARLQFFHHEPVVSSYQIGRSDGIGTRAKDSGELKVKQGERPAAGRAARLIVSLVGETLCGSWPSALLDQLTRTLFDEPDGV